MRVPEFRIGDVLKWAVEYDGSPFHALLCDPPYHLTSITKRFGKEGSAPAKHGTDGVYSRASAGFMGQQWDGGDIAFRPETWAALGKHLHPGAFIMAFAGTRGYHRMACAIEDADFILHPMIVWAFGSGFPKATRVKDDRFAGHRYGLQAMKPALECIAVAQKSYKGNPQENIRRTGAGVLNIDGGRVAGGGVDPSKIVRRAAAPDCVYALGKDTHAHEKPGYHPKGRWPANFCLDEHAAEVLDAQSGTLASGMMAAGQQRMASEGLGGYHNSMPNCATANGTYGDEGGASRFYHVSDWQAEEHDLFFYTAKAGTSERNAGLDSFPLQDSGVWDGRMSQSETRIIGNTAPVPQRNVHPTVKPLRLCKWLATLLLPPDTYAPRRLLVPFSGSGSEAIGAMLAGWDEMTGVELSEEYATIARARSQFWSGNVGLFEGLTATGEGIQAQGVLELRPTQASKWAGK